MLSWLNLGRKRGATQLPAGNRCILPSLHLAVATTVDANGRRPLSAVPAPQDAPNLLADGADAVARRHDHGDTSHDLGTHPEKGSPQHHPSSSAHYRKLCPPHHASILEALREPLHVACLLWLCCWRRGGSRRRTTPWSTSSKRSCATCVPGGSLVPYRVAVVVPNSDLQWLPRVPGTVVAAASAYLGARFPLEAEFANQLTTLGVRAVMVLRGHETVARAAAVVVRDSPDRAGRG